MVSFYKLEGILCDSSYLVQVEVEQVSNLQCVCSWNQVENIATGHGHFLYRVQHILWRDGQSESQLNSSHITAAVVLGCG